MGIAKMKKPTFHANGHIQFDVVEHVAEYLALEEEWGRLWARCDGQSDESFNFCRRCLTNNSSGEKSRLLCVTGRQNGTLILVWPLTISKRGLWRVARPLSGGAVDYTVFLVDTIDGARDITLAALKVIMARSRADILSLPYIREDRPLYALFPRPKSFSLVTGDCAPIVLLKNEPDWESFIKGLRSKPSKHPKEFLRRLGREGHVALNIYGRDDRLHCEKFVDWIFLHKARWAKRAGKYGHWLDSSDYRNLLVSLLQSSMPSEPYWLLVVTLNERPLAACMVGEGRSIAHLIITAFDDAYAKLSPGSAMMESLVRWAFDRRIDLDLGVGDEPYKRYWSKDNLVRTVSLTVPLSAWGGAALLSKRILSSTHKQDKKN
ncbi:GNAT family N-acetyltransferase [Caballeronia arvi]|nr:GNAT family N-acetyltransferase [Caballeronia arvi]